MAKGTRNLTAGLTGGGSVLIGTGLPLVGLAVGLVFQTIERDRVHATVYENIIDGLVDGSAAILGYAIAHRYPVATGTAIVVSPVPPVPMVRPLLDDSDALVG
jgi:hypothetical protein